MSDGKNTGSLIFFCAHAMNTVSNQTPSVSHSLVSEEPERGNAQTDRRKMPNQYAPNPNF